MFLISAGNAPNGDFAGNFLCAIVGLVNILYPTAEPSIVSVATSNVSIYITVENQAEIPIFLILPFTGTSYEPNVDSLTWDKKIQFFLDLLFANVKSFLIAIAKSFQPPLESSTSYVNSCSNCWIQNDNVSTTIVSYFDSSIISRRSITSIAVSGTLTFSFPSGSTTVSDFPSVFNNNVVSKSKFLSEFVLPEPLVPNTNIDFLFIFILLFFGVYII